jgi:hypothetical protein
MRWLVGAAILSGILGCWSLALWAQWTGGRQQ